MHKLKPQRCRRLCPRLPDNIVWTWRWDQHFLFGWDRQSYSYDAICWSIFFGPLTLRWHRR